MNSLLTLKNISVAYGDQTIVQNIDFDLQEGQISCLLGPSGCGKTTLLRTIAGFENPTQGEIAIRSKVVSTAEQVLAPEERQIGMVFQDFALFPHLDIEANIRFGLTNKMSENMQLQRCNELLELVGLSGSNHKYPHQLSGGQQQRIALARALAPKPDILLLDEPFSSLDIELRQQLAREVRVILKQQNITAILVTHDQNEAFAMADTVGLIHKAELVQWDTPYNLYHKPATRFVANFIGQGVFIPGEYIGEQKINTDLGIIRGNVPEQCETGCRLDLLIRPDDIIHDDDSPIKLEITEKLFRGSDFLYTLKLQSGRHVLCIASSHHNHALHEKIGIRLDVDHLVMFPQLQIPNIADNIAAIIV
ncbi:MAG: ABC transporter ATP-binding protein [Gammaproteobacteria bacterium]|nr:ABC transporter ATP-binding protein [Gammaproteobacteria bacterium]